MLQLDLHTAKQTARELESLRQLFLGRLHEEFRGPLGSVIGAATLLYEKLSDPQAREEAEHIQEQALSIQSLLSDMVVIAQNCGKHLPVSQVRFNLRQEIIRVFSTVALEARERNITFFCNVAGTLDRSIYANKVGLSHVFAVLLGHLVRAIPTDYVISVSCHPIQSAKADCIDFECKLAVSSGDPAVKVVPQRLGFDTRTIGEGAGLSIKNSPYMAVSHILDSLNGVLEVSTSADRGVSFRVFVPELSLVEHLDLVEEEEDDSEKLTSLRVLVVDDDRTIQMVLSRFLERRGHQVVVAENGIEAIREFRQGSFDLVFMDIRMPECDGYEATDSIRAIERQLGWRRVPIYGISAHVDMDAAGKWKQFGMDGAFVKPVGLQVLESLLIEIVAERNARLGMVVNDELEENESYES